MVVFGVVKQLEGEVFGFGEDGFWPGETFEGFEFLDGQQEYLNVVGFELIVDGLTEELDLVVVVDGDGVMEGL
jgi:hypothetical protein